MKKRSVLFLPDEISLDVDSGTDLLTAASMASIQIKASCGGDGTCGKCLIRIKNGQASYRYGYHPSEEHQANGLSLACQTYVQEEDLVVEIPKSSKLAKHQVLLEPAGRLVNGHSLRPLCRRIKIKLSPPDLQDICDDKSRLLVALKKTLNTSDIYVPLRIVQTLGEVLRKGSFSVTVQLVEYDGKTEILLVEPGFNDKELLGLAVDIGTTTVAAYLLNLNSGEIIKTAGCHNLQARFGDDVISRIVYSVEEKAGLAELHQAVVTTVNDLIEELLLDSGCKETEIMAVMAAGNTTMSHLFYAISPQYIRLEPYIPTANVYPVVTGRDLKLKVNQDAKVLLFPSVASYVGGDIVAGTLFTGMARNAEKISLLIDIGTNGEMVLGSAEWLVACSCSAGPAFEGAGITFGMRAMQGAIERLEIEPDTFEVRYNTINDVKPLGICGSALIDCLAKMREAGIIDRAGKFQTTISTARMRTGEGGPEFVLAWCAETELDRDLVITEADVKNLLRAKAAVYAGIRTLLQMVSMELACIDQIYVAGGFGNYLNILEAIKIGLLPDVPEEKYQFIGNSSLKGAGTALLNQEAWLEAQELAAKMTYIELSVGHTFMEEFVSAMFIPHTDLSLFPTVGL